MYLSLLCRYGVAYEEPPPAIEPSAKPSTEPSAGQPLPPISGTNSDEAVATSPLRAAAAANVAGDDERCEDHGAAEE